MERIMIYLSGDIKVEIEEVEYNGVPNYSITVTGHRSQTHSQIYVPIPKEKELEE